MGWEAAGSARGLTATGVVLRRSLGWAVTRWLYGAGCGPRGRGCPPPAPPVGVRRRQRRKAEGGGRLWPDALTAAQAVALVGPNRVASPATDDPVGPAAARAQPVPPPAAVEPVPAGAARQPVAARAAAQAVGTGAAPQQVRAPGAVEPVPPTAAVEPVVAVSRRGAGATGQLRPGAAPVAEQGVVASATPNYVRAGEPADHVVSSIPGQHVVAGRRGVVEQHRDLVGGAVGDRQVGARVVVEVADRHRLGVVAGGDVGGTGEGAVALAVHEPDAAGDGVGDRQVERCAGVEVASHHRPREWDVDGEGGRTAEAAVSPAVQHHHAAEVDVVRDRQVEVPVGIEVAGPTELGWTDWSPAGKGVGPVKPPWPLPSRIETLAELKLATARSGRESALKSPTATD